MQYYLRIIGDDFGFVAEDIHQIVASDIKITVADYQTFLSRQQTDFFRLRPELPASGGLFDYVESYIPEPSGSEPPTETQLLQLALAEAIEKQEADNLASQLALAEYIESQAQGGE